MLDKEFENKILNTIMIKQQILINDIFNIIDKKYIEKSKIKELIKDYTFTEHNGCLNIPLKALNKLLEG